MSHLHAPSLRFAASFVDAVTVAPFYADLKRLRKQSVLFGNLPGHELEEVEVEAEAAADAA